MKYTVKPTTRFQKDLKRVKKRGYNLDLLTKTIKILASGDSLDPMYKDHALVGNFVGCRECHIQPDWLLIYEIIDSDLILYLTRIGTHSDLYNKFLAAHFL
ncbi:MAG: type II toxin-antitoxin system YafQ family toxin [Clostridiales bacterium]|nr:type II toxin-antitoxin system YafQ family toxin [Clostridiales bacterium]